MLLRLASTAAGAPGERPSSGAEAAPPPEDGGGSQPRLDQCSSLLLLGVVYGVAGDPLDVAVRNQAQVQASPESPCSRDLTSRWLQR